MDASGLGDVIAVDSAGTGDWHIGRSPDQRTAQVAASRGYDLSELRARLVTGEDFDQFDYVIAMDRANLQNLNPCVLPILVVISDCSWICLW